VNAKLLAVVMISGLVLSGSSVYLSKMAFADDPWSQIAQRQLVAQQTAAMVYSDKYQYNNMNGSQRNWSGLSSTTTDENTAGRNLAAISSASLNNALAEFDKTYVTQLQSSQSTNYTGLNSSTTGENGRDRNTLIADARDQSLNASQSIVSQSSMVSANYKDLNDSGTTNEQNSGNRQAQIEKTWNSMDVEASALLGNLTGVNTAYLNLQSGGTTNENTLGYQLGAEQAASESNGVQIFQEIHAKVLSATYSTDYAGLNSATTNEQNAYSRNAAIENERTTSLQNALNFYNDYYQDNGLNQTTYSH
jgi:hypothetical protein